MPTELLSSVGVTLANVCHTYDVNNDLSILEEQSYANHVIICLEDSTLDPSSDKSKYYKDSCKGRMNYSHRQQLDPIASR